MTRFFITCLLIAGLTLLGGCRKTTSDNPSTILTSPADAEEAALQVVGTLYGVYAISHKNGPQGWNDLKAQASNASASAEKKALDAIEQVQVADYKMTWGANLSLIEKEGIKPDEYVIAESSDGLRQLMFGGNVKTAKSDTKKGRQN
jgi:hypothetical protein